MAAALDVHPQTVRYRVRQLRDLFGERLEDPEARFELALALRVTLTRAATNSRMRLLLTGAAGMLGSDVAAAARRRATTSPSRAAELDVRDAAAVHAPSLERRLDAVVNCAAWTDVDGAEAEEDQRPRRQRRRRRARRRRGRGGRRLHRPRVDRLRLRRRAREPYTSRRRPRRGAYGRSKLAGEHRRRRRRGRGPLAIVRTAWLFGAHGQNFVATMLRLARERDAVTVVDDQVGCPTFTGHLAPRLVVAQSGRLGVLHGLAGACECSWCDLARATFAGDGYDVRLAPGRTADLGRPAPRRVVRAPLRAPRRALLPPWQDGLAAYLELQGAPREAARLRRGRLHRLELRPPARRRARRRRHRARQAHLRRARGEPARRRRPPRLPLRARGIEDADAVAEAIEGADAVVNFAAETHVDRSIAEPGRVHPHACARHLRAARGGAGARRLRFVQVSTDEVYGSIEEGRSRRPRRSPSSPTRPPRPAPTCSSAPTTTPTGSRR